MAIPNPANLISDRSKLIGFFGTEPNAVGDIPIDVIVSETPSESWQLSEHPVEAGQTIVDARIRDPLTLRLECIVTDDLSDISIGAISQVVKGGVKTWKAKAALLQEMVLSDDLVEVRTPLRTYSDLSVTSFVIDQTASTSQALFFTLELRELELVESQLEFVDEAAIPKRKKKKKTTDNTKSEDKQTKKLDKGKKQADRDPIYTIAEQVTGITGISL